MKCLVFLGLLISVGSLAQPVLEEDKFIAKMTKTEVAPAGLLAGRSAVLFSDDYTADELLKIQKAFQQTGIDAVEYFRTAMILAGKDLQIAYAPIFTRRNIKFLIFVRKENGEYQIWFLPFNPKNVWTNPSLSAWFVHAQSLQDALVNIFRTLSSTQKRENFLINDIPEQEITPNIFANTRNESMISNLKAFKIAIPGMGNAAADLELAEYFKANFHGRYEIVTDTLREKEMMQSGFKYVLRYVHAPGQLAKEILGYDMSKSESALASVTYPNGSLKLKTIPSQATVYKFYMKDLEDKNIYFGVKWDADETWQEALKNYIDGYRVTGRIN